MNCNEFKEMRDRHERMVREHGFARYLKEIPTAERAAAVFHMLDCQKCGEEVSEMNRKSLAGQPAGLVAAKKLVSTFAGMSEMRKIESDPELREEMEKRAKEWQNDL
jgi:hypothetical protein